MDLTPSTSLLTSDAVCSNPLVAISGHLGPDYLVQKTVMGKKATFGRYAAWQVIDVHQEEAGPENCT